MRDGSGRQESGRGQVRPASRNVCRNLAFAAAVVPLALSGCTSTQSSKLATSKMAAKPASGAADAFGYAPVHITAFADGTRIALPSAKPDLARINAAEAAKPAVKGGRLHAAARPAAPAAPVAGGSTPASADGSTPVASEDAAALDALKADVADRKAETAIQTIADASASKQAFRPGSEPVVDAQTPVAAAAAEAQPASDTSTVAAIAAVPVKGARAVAGGARIAVAKTIETVGNGAEAAKEITVAAIDTTVDTARRVRERIGDTFKGTDTITGSTAIDRMIEQSAAENNIPSELAYAFVRVESHYNPTAIGGGAYGLSQIKPATARGLGFAGPANGLFDPATNLRYGMKYLAGAWELSGHDVCGTAMRYKGGHRTTRMTKAASVYCSNVKRHMAAIERRRGPVNGGTIVAAAEREKTIAVASREALPGVPDRTARSILSAAGSKAGRTVAGSAPSSYGAIAASAPGFATAETGERSGRILVGAALD